MANPTTNYSFAMPTNTDLVKDLPADFEVFGQAVDTQMKTNADAAIPKTIVDAKGDLIAATAADTVARLAVGSNGTVLVADSAESTGMKWALPSSGGMTLLSTTTLSGTSVNLTSIPSTYNKLYVVVSGALWGTGVSILQFLPNSLTTQYAIISRVDNGSPEVVAAVNDVISSRLTTLNTGANNVFVLEIDNYASASYFKAFRYWGYQERSAGPAAWLVGGGIRTTSAVSSLEIKTSNAYTFSAGQVLLYGVK